LQDESADDLAVELGEPGFAGFDGRRARPSPRQAAPGV